jgi:hypothetical protein
MHKALLLSVLLVAFAATCAADVMRVKLRKAAVDPTWRRVHHANKTRLISQQVSKDDGEKIDIINFMDAQVRCYLERGFLGFLCLGFLSYFMFTGCSYAAKDEVVPPYKHHCNCFLRCLTKHPFHFKPEPISAVLRRDWTGYPSAKVHGMSRRLPPCSASRIAV